MEPTSMYFDVLPMHPQPEWLESFTGYLTRLAEANQIRSMRTWSSVCFPAGNPMTTRALKDYPPLTFGALSVIATCSLPALQATTFCHVADKFGRLPHSRAFHQLLNQALAPRLRYCPLCLIEQPYYALPWRFLILTGCVRHGCRLLDRCGHCQQALPLFTSPFKVGVCPACEQDLSTCRSEPLPETERDRLSNRFQDLVFLLSPHPGQAAELAAWPVGRRLAHCRRMRHWQQIEVAHHLGSASARMVSTMERMNGNRQHLTLQDYIQYADCLGLTLREVFSLPLPAEAAAPTDLERRSRSPAYARQSEWLDKAQKAIQTLEESGKPVTQETVSQVVGLSVAALIRYPQIKTLFETFTLKSPGKVRRFQDRQDELLDQAQAAIQNLAKLGRPMSQSAIGLMMGTNAVALERYPRVRALLQQTAAEDAQRRQAELVEKTGQAVEHLRSLNQRISPRAVGVLIGRSPADLRYHRELLAIVNQAEQERRGEAARRRQAEKQAQEERALIEVQKAIQQLAARGEPVLHKVVSQMVGISKSAFAEYPRVKALVRQVIAQQRRG